MAALGKIRSKGVTLIIIIGLALFAFIAEEAFRSCEGIKGEARQQVGEVLGKKINVQEFQTLIEEYSNVQKVLSGRETLTDQEQNELYDRVWQMYVTNKVIEADAEHAGMTVTDQEITDIMTQGTSPLLQQAIPIPQFYNQQTGRFDVNAVKTFLDQYEKSKNTPQAAQMEEVYQVWLFCEKQLRQNLLTQKYQNLLASCVISNKVEAEFAFNDANEESEIQLATLAYSSIKDTDVKVTDEELKAKYEELKALFVLPVETRDIKYVDVQIVASATDKAGLNKSFATYQQQLATAEDPAEVVTKSASEMPYIGLPLSNTAYQNLSDTIKNLEIGTTGVFEMADDNTLNIVRLIAKQTVPDSIEFRQIQVAGKTVEESRQKADSIYNALQGGADFEELAKKYGQTGEKNWFTGNMYEHATSMNIDNRNYLEAILNGEVNATKNVELTQGNIILQVTDRRDMKEKYQAAVIKKPISFTKDTRTAYYNKFSEYVSKCQTVEDLQKNAVKYGYQVQEAKDINVSSFMYNGQMIPAAHELVQIAKTREALRWLFNAKEGDLSQIYDCGDNDHYLVVALTKVHPQGYRTLEDEQVKEFVTRQVMNDKKAEKIMAKLKGVNSINAAKAKGAKISTVSQITFAANTMVQETGSFEPALSGAVAATKAGQFSKNPVKGNAGVYMFQVVKKAKRAGVKFNLNEQMSQCAQVSLQYAYNFMQDLMNSAKVSDSRYLFF